MKIQRLLATILIFLPGVAANAQSGFIDGTEAADPGVGAKGTAPLRTEFISYDIRELAEKDDLSKNQYYKELVLVGNPVAGGPAELTSVIEVPYMWLDRQLFLQVEGFGSYYVLVNGRAVAYGEDNRTPAQFDISDYVTDGNNAISLRIERGTGSGLDTPAPAAQKVFLFSQPKVRIEDYKVRLVPDTTGKHAMLSVKLALANSYNSAETITVGYDIYGPQGGRVLTFNNKQVEIAGRGRDTVEFREPIWRVGEYLWSVEKPNLFHGMLTVKRGVRMTEYLHYKVGLGATSYQDGRILRNGKPLTVNAASYNAAADRKKTTEQIVALKKQGINTVCTDYPQPVWFYDICDQQGMYVIDQPNINSSDEGGNRAGAISNNPEWLDSFLARTEAMYTRVQNHSCVIGWSLGGSVGNGFNMYRAYLRLKELEVERAVIFNDAAGEWNTDTLPVTKAEGAEVLSRPVPRSGSRR